MACTLGAVALTNNHPPCGNRSVDGVLEIAIGEILAPHRRHPWGWCPPGTAPFVRSPRPSPAMLLPVLLSLAPDVLVVDDDPGGDFLEIQAAVEAAADGDTILVRAGQYAPVFVDGRGVTITADTDALVELPALLVRNTSSDQRFVARGLDVVPTGLATGLIELGIEIEDCAGTVLIEDCRAIGPMTGPDLLFPPSPATRVRSSDNVFLVDVLSFGSESIQQTFETTGGRGLSCVFSTLSIFGGEYRGGPGLDGDGPFLFFNEPGSGGGDGMVVDSSELFLSGVTIVGGDGGDGVDGGADGGFVAPCSEGGNGGDALDAPSTTVTYRDTAFVVGVGGLGGAPLPDSPACPDGVPGEVIAGAMASIVSEAGAARALDVSPNPIREGELATIRFTGEPGDSVLWALSPQASAAPIPFLGGPVLIGGTPFLLATGVVPAGGELVTTVPLGSFAPGVEAIELVEQALHVAVGGEVVISSPSLVVHLIATL